MASDLLAQTTTESLGHLLQVVAYDLARASIEPELTPIARLDARAHPAIAISCSSWRNIHR